MQCDVYHSAQWPEVFPVWDKLLLQSSNASFFLTSDWVATWLDVYGPSLDPEILVFHDDDGPAGTCLLVRRKRRVGPVWLRSVYLNTAGELPADSVCVEYNDVLVARGKESAVAATLVAHLNRQPWDEFLLNGCQRESAIPAVEQHLATHMLARQEEPAYYVDLDVLRQNGVSFGDSLRQPTRKHVRQYLRYCGEIGEVSVCAATTTEQALAMLSDLTALHQERWTAKGMQGAFASSLFLQFHESLVRRCFPSGSIRLIRVRAGDTPVGIIYGFVFRGIMYFYQSGINYNLPSRVSPGIVANVCAIQHCLENGLSQYDFLAGDAQYKRMLSSSQRQLDWISVRRRGWRFGLVDSLRALKRRAVASRAASPDVNVATPAGR
jgi:CelD/BcsL family acetyltransferase involved in cellulose biosynthesis